MGIEDGFEAPSLRSAGDPTQPRIETPGPTRQDHAGDRERQGDGDETDDEGAEIGLNERVEIDPRVLRWAVRV